MSAKIVELMRKNKILLYNCINNSQQSQKQAINSSDLKIILYEYSTEYSAQNIQLKHPCLKFHN
ncbi:hypothetical protein GCM10007028_14010 [Algibacter mikhailovii]|uniref:Uncharacterized protein n=1 Tax=Algibacter mikhailovii TaxID=425498 RepID=A0A918V7Y3_9FLAO|nr:hypothetical protein GCM10007028_14010 [Algibacter mikhailovii]